MTKFSTTTTITTMTKTITFGRISFFHFFHFLSVLFNFSIWWSVAIIHRIFFYITISAITKSLFKSYGKNYEQTIGRKRVKGVEEPSAIFFLYFRRHLQNPLRFYPPPNTYYYIQFLHRKKNFIRIKTTKHKQNKTKRKNYG